MPASNLPRFIRSTVDTELPDREPPTNTEAEQAVVGTLLHGTPRQQVAMLAEIEAADFWREAHWLIVSAMEELAARREPITPHTVHAELKARHQIEDAGGVEYLRALEGRMHHALHPERLARYVHSLAQRRRLSHEARLIADDARNTELEWQSVVNSASARVQGILRDTVSHSTGLRDMAALEDPIMRTVEAAAAGERTIGPVRWGVQELDWATMPLENQRLCILKGDRGVGKTQWAVHTVCSTARALRDADAPGHILVFTFEGRNIYQNRMLSWVSKIDANILRRGFDGTSDWGREVHRRLRMAQNDLASYPVSLCEDVTDQASIEARIRVAADTTEVAMVVVDYWQAMRFRAGRREIEEYEAAAFAFRDLADELACPFVVLSQVSFNRDTGQWMTKGSRAIQDAAYLELRMTRDEKAAAGPRYEIACDKTRITPQFAPIAVQCDWGTSTLVSARTQADAERLARGHGLEVRDHDQ